ncbi:hypothetical protein BCR33DRAFT_721659 [Rhizoclosmatium globosum]|uniref:Uncharacterized protein n=1 Tax=Rhizoclosmatium globosum TaxID=329046 RepID=A0A1Y2BQH9_9FUNG|nr:hypothetical protein BCR33DRAFT_721659 [Rhizoclosmatium globosum]|eukprot:ORY37004.1 hypothetical protein BCR33DRAFT_721659 [Rhizoclosmatium globosum]
MSMFKAEHSAPEQVTLDQVPTRGARGMRPTTTTTTTTNAFLENQVPRGRKRLVAPAASQSAAKAREAQRRLRDKKAQLVANLERENKLSIKCQVLTVASPSASLPCIQMIHLLPNQSEKTMPYLPTQSPAFSQATVPFDDATATEESDLDWVDVKDAANSNSMRRKSARAAMFSLASVQNSPSAQTNVNQLLDLFAVPQTHHQKYLVAITAARFRILDECTLLDRQQFILHLDNFIQLNAKHCKNYTRYSETPNTTDQAPRLPSPPSHSLIILPTAHPSLRDALTAIPSFASAGDLIDELCSLYWSFTSEDRIRFLVATEIGRESNRNHMDELLKE